MKGCRVGLKRIFTDEGPKEKENLTHGFMAKWVKIRVGFFIFVNTASCRCRFDWRFGDIKTTN
ncbi:hypothetical protein CRYUN_Cryun38cG0084300 [Craigia yunnanensis]